VELCYGQELGPPQYDLALLAGRLRDAPAREVALAPLSEAPEGGLAGPKVFWGVLAAAVVGLLAVLARLLKAQPGPD